MNKRTPTLAVLPVLASLFATLLAAALVSPCFALDCPLDESFWPYGPGWTAETWSSGAEHLLLAGSGSALKIFDVADPSSLDELGEVALSDPIWHIDIEDGGDLAAVSDREKWVHLVDISNRSAPVELGRYEVEDGRRPYGLAFAGDLLVVAVAPAGLWVLDVSDPTAPTLVGQSIEPGTDFVFDVDVFGTHAFIADDIEGVTVIDFSDPATPTRVGGFAGADGASHITIVGSRAYVSRRGSGLMILDLTVPATPTLVGTYGGYTYRTGVSGDHAFLASSSGTEVLDIQTPSMPTSVGTFGDDAFSLAVDGDIVFTLPPSARPTVLTATDYSTPAAPVVTDTVDFMDESRHVAIVGDIGLVANDDRGLVTLDLTQEGVLSTIGRYEFNNARSVAAVGQNAVVATFGGTLPVIDFSDPAMPVSVATATISGTSYDVVSQGQLVYVAANFGGLRILDLSTPTSPTELGSFVPSGGGGTAVSVQGNTAFLTSNTSGWVVDVTDPTLPVELATFSLPATSYDSAVDGDHLYVAHQSGVTIFDASTPSALAEVAFVPSAPSPANGLAVADDRLYIAGDTFWGLLVFDVSDPTDPIFLESIDTPGSALRVAVDPVAGRILLADSDNGARLFACSRQVLFADGFESGDTTGWSSTIP